MAGHVYSVRLYIAVFAGLILLTGATVGLSYLELGIWHAPIGLVIASAKALLVILFFMHVLHSSRLTWIVVLASAFWLAILMSLTLTDFASRN